MANGDAAAFGEWCLVELMGHRRVAALVTEQTLAGQGFLRLDVPAGPDRVAATQLVNPSSVYAIHPVTEAIAREMADSWHHQPVQRWEVKSIAAADRDQRAAERKRDEIVDALYAAASAAHDATCGTAANAPLHFEACERPACVKWRQLAGVDEEVPF